LVFHSSTIAMMHGPTNIKFHKGLFFSGYRLNLLPPVRAMCSTLLVLTLLR